jgi:hypothetical protein
MPSHTCVSQLDSHVKETTCKRHERHEGVMGSMNMPHTCVRIPHTCVSTHLGLERRLARRLAKESMIR